MGMKTFTACPEALDFHAVLLSLLGSIAKLLDNFRMFSHALGGVEYEITFVISQTSILNFLILSFEILFNNFKQSGCLWQRV